MENTPLHEFFFKATECTDESSIESLLNEGYRAFIQKWNPERGREDLKKFAHWSQMNKGHEPVIIIFPEVEDLEQIIRAIMTSEIKERLLTTDKVGIVKTFSSGIYEWPPLRVCRGEIIIAAPNSKEEGGRFVMTDQFIVFQYSDLKNKGFFKKERDDDLIDLNRNIIHNSIKKNRIVTVRNDLDKKWEKRSLANLRSRGFQILPTKIQQEDDYFRQESIIPRRRRR